ncbi:MAG TPA: winged helix-turn-helix domain-containing protein [Candidatus Eisenbacteria bacterium]|nr:winged helix-turn-helix domain-containing protein [Candidatus Eisenbacteria bacterium]
MPAKTISRGVVERIAQELRDRRSGSPISMNSFQDCELQLRNPSAKFRFGNQFELDTFAHELRFFGEPRKLSRTPLQVLHLLLERPGRLVHRREIVQRIWGDAVCVDTDRNINETIRRIRRALDEDPEQPRFLQTVYGIGYRFIAPVTRVTQ